MNSFMQYGALVLSFGEQIENMFRAGTAFQQVMIDQSPQQRGSSSTNVEQDLVFVILLIYCHEL